MRLIATDLDGTLLRTDGTVSPRTVEMLRRADAAGVTVLLATARPLRSVRPVAALLGHSGLAICSNGAVVYDVRTDAVVGVRPIQTSVVLDVVDAVRRAIPPAAFAVETVANGFGQEPHYATHVGDTGGQPTIAPVTELVTDDLIKLLVQHQSMSVDQLLDATNSATAGHVEVTHSSGIGLLEISAKNVTKASTLADLAAQRGMSAADVIAFGDMPNDIPMLAWAGSSYAMANAHPDVSAAADHVAPSNDDDGVAVTLSAL